jgi:hypothetical protein
MSHHGCSGAGRLTKFVCPDDYLGPDSDRDLRAVRPVFLRVIYATAGPGPAAAALSGTGPRRRGRGVTLVGRKVLKIRHLRTETLFLHCVAAGVFASRVAWLGHRDFRDVLPGRVDE